VKVPELESQENETGNEMSDLLQPDKTEAVETSASSRITEVRKEEQQEYSAWYQHNDHFDHSLERIF
jgi:hypothetical protein